MTTGLYFPATPQLISADGPMHESSSLTSRDSAADPSGLSSVAGDRTPAERLRGAELAAAIITWLYESSDDILVGDDGEDPVRLDVLLEAIYELRNDRALVRRLSKFFALILVTHRWPMTIHGTTAVPPTRVLNLIGVNRA